MNLAILLFWLTTGTLPGSFNPCGGDAGPWLLVYRYVVNVQEEPNGTPVYETREMFDGRRYESEEQAYCGAERVRLTGVALPTLGRFGRESNVMPETITPMPSLQAVKAGIHGVLRAGE